MNHILNVKKEVFLNIILEDENTVKKPTQLMHMDIKQPGNGILLFGHFLGQLVTNGQHKGKFHIESINLAVVETEIFSKTDQPVYHTVINGSCFHDPLFEKKYPDGTKKVMNQIKLQFEKTSSPILKDYHYQNVSPNLYVNNGDPMDIHMEGVITKNKKIEKDETLTFSNAIKSGPGLLNINSHICQLKFYF